MANYIVSNAKFKPFSYAELVAPIKEYTEAYNELEGAFGAIDAERAAIENEISQTDDPEAYKRLTAYKAELDKQSNLLAKEGLKAVNRKQFMDMRTRYAQDIDPIQKALKKRAALAEEQRKLMVQDSSRRFERDFTKKGVDTSIDRFLENPNYNYGAQISGEDITKATGAMASELADQFSGISTGRVDAYTKSLIKKYGLTPSDIQEFIDNPKSTNNPKILNIIRDYVLGTIAEPMREQYGDFIDSYINRGLFRAIGKDEVSTYADPAAVYRLNHPESDYPTQLPRLKGLQVDTFSFIDPDYQAEVSKGLNNYSQYFYKDPNDGKYYMTEAGMREYKHQKDMLELARTNKAGSAGWGTGNLPDTDLAAFVDKHLLQGEQIDTSDITKVRTHKQRLGEAYRKIRETPDNYADAYKISGISYNYDQGSDYQKRVKVLFGRNNGNSSFTVVKIKANDENGEIVETNEEINIAECDIISTVSTPAGLITILRNKKGEYKYIKTPVNDETTKRFKETAISQANISKRYAKISKEIAALENKYGENLYDNKEALDKYVKLVTEALKLEKHINDISQLELLNIGKLIPVTKTEVQTINP